MLSSFSAPPDLAYKKILPALQALIRRGDLNIPIVGWRAQTGRSTRCGVRARDSLEHNGGLDRDAFIRLCARLRYVGGDYKDPATYERLRQALNGAERPLHYLAIPPSLFATVVRGLAKAGCARGARVIVEKPFGRDLASAQMLNQALHEVYPEPAVFRIDHVLGKEAVQNLLYFRFANAFLDPRSHRGRVRKAGRRGKGAPRPADRRV
jgi:glucose-6-phosphate 1-dehydrogenase